MPVDTINKEIRTLIDHIRAGEINLPEIQRGFVWKPTQVAKLIDSLYRGYPSGSLLFWQAEGTPVTRPLAIGSRPGEPAVPPLYLLDGQQRLTSLYRVFTDHKDAQIVFNPETEKFQNQSAATAKDPRWIKVHDVLREKANVFEIHDRLIKTGVVTPSPELGERLTRLAGIAQRRFHMEILRGYSDREVSEIFVRVNSGRPLKITDLALATLSTRWPGTVGRLEKEARHWAKRHYPDLDVIFLTRALTGVVLGSGLSMWSHSRLTEATDEELERGWETVKRGLRHLVALLRENLKINHSGLIPSHIAMLPLIVLLGERPEEPLDAETRDGILYWFLLAGLRARYSGSTDTRLGQDIPAAREEQPTRKLLRNLGIVGARIEVTPSDLAGKGSTSAYYFLSYLVAKNAGAQDWWSAVEISAASEDAYKLESHHIHPQATLKRHSKKYSKTEINDLANLAFISGRANRVISDRSPAEYFVDSKLPPLTQADLAAHFVAYDEPLRHADNYREFLTARRRLLAAAMTELLERFRPGWLDQAAAVTEPLPGCSLSFSLYESPWDVGIVVVDAKVKDATWAGFFEIDDLVRAVDAADEGIDGDLTVSDEASPVRVDGDTVEITIGPLVVTGTIASWRAVIAHERETASPLSELPKLEKIRWEGDRLPYPVTSTE